MKKILLFNCPIEINNLLLKKKLDFKVIEQNYQNNTIEKLLLNDDLRSNQVLHFNESLIVFNDYSDFELNEVLSIIKENNISIDLKCIVTEYNINWKVIKLYDELLKEKKAMQHKA